MKLRQRLAERRRQKARRDYLRERARQEALAGKDAAEAVREVARGSASAQQGMYGQM